MRIRFSRAVLFAFPLAFGILLNSQTNAAAAAKKAPNPYAAEITALRAVNALLAKADHDYKGHRVKAMADILATVKILHQAGGKGKGGKKLPGKGLKKNPDPKLPQDVSDGYLVKAAKDLAGIQASLSKKGGKPSGAAVAEIAKAIKQLDLALKAAPKGPQK
jgi:hypothetical protein